MTFSDSYATSARLSVLETFEFCDRMQSGCEYTGPYRPDGRLQQFADEYLHSLMGYRSEHSDPLAF